MTGLKAEQTLLVVATAVKKSTKWRSKIGDPGHKKADRTAAVSEIELALSTRKRPSIRDARVPCRLRMGENDVSPRGAI
jgi:hypothetical protein